MFIQVKSKNKIRKPKSISVMYVCYFLLFTIFSLDFGFVRFKSQKTNVLAKIASLAMSLFLGLTSTCFVGINSPDRAVIAWQIKFILEYYVYIFILLLIPDDKTFFSYQKRLHYVDVKLGMKSSKYKGDFKILSYILFLVAYQFGMSQLFCLMGNTCQSIILSITFFIPTLSYCTTHVIFFFIFYFPYMRLVELKKCIEAGSLTIRHSHCLYRSLINSTEQVLEGFKLIFLTSLIFNIPGIMTFIYMMLKNNVYSQLSMSVVVLQNITLSVSFVIRFLPCIPTSMLYHKAGQIRIILHDKLVEERDQVRAQEIERFISYIEARPFQFYVLLLIPMDSTLPLMLLNLCVTYFIVVIQLTHLI